MIKIQIDSRKVEKGDTFVAIVGEHFDGHDYIEEAIRKGATKVVVSNNKNYSVETMNVDNTFNWLTDYLKENYSKEFKDMKFVGITGTNGKTTLVTMVYEVCQKLNIKCANIGTMGFFYDGKYEPTLNTTPDILSFYKMLFKAKEAGCKVVVMEVSSIGLMQNRMNGIDFDIAVFTNLTHEHLNVHKTMKNYMEAKLLLFKKLKKDGHGIVYYEDKYAKNFMIAPHNTTYGFSKEADMRCVRANRDYSTFKYSFEGNTYSISSQLIGKYNAANNMALLLIMHYLGVDFEKVNEVYPSCERPKGRMEVFNYKNSKIIVDYANTPDSFKKAIGAVKEMTDGKLYTLFGCAGNRDREKRPMMGRIATKNSYLTIVTEDDPWWEETPDIIKEIVKDLDPKKYIIEYDRKKAIHMGADMLKDGDVLLVLGKGHETDNRVKDKLVPCNDLEIVKNICESVIKN